jgi:hypothetical protein
MIPPSAPLWYVYWGIWRLGGMGLCVGSQRTVGSGEATPWGCLGYAWAPKTTKTNTCGDGQAAPKPTAFERKSPGEMGKRSPERKQGKSPSTSGSVTHDPHFARLDREKYSPAAKHPDYASLGVCPLVQEVRRKKPNAEASVRTRNEMPDKCEQTRPAAIS